MDEETLREQGREVGRSIQARIAANRKTTLEEWKETCQRKVSRFKGAHKKANTKPSDARVFLTQGGMRTIEYAIGAKAADEAIEFEREAWLPRLERWIRIYDDDDPIRHFLEKEIKRLQRCLGIRKPLLTLEERRAQVRERVRKHRQTKVS